MILLLFLHSITVSHFLYNIYTLIINQIFLFGVHISLDYFTLCQFLIFFFTSLLIIIHYSFFNSIFFSFSFSLRLFFFLSTGSELFLRINNIVKPNIYSYITYYTIIFEKKYVQFLKVVLELYFN